MLELNTPEASESLRDIIIDRHQTGKVGELVVKSLGYYGSEDWLCHYRVFENF